MDNIVFDYSNSFIGENEIKSIEPIIACSHELLHTKMGAGKEYTGWIEWPNNYDKEEFNRIKEKANGIREISDTFIVIGIGGSYLGARACIEALNHSFYNMLPKEKRRGPEIYYVGNNISSTYISDIFDILEDKDICINVISKSGTTTEPALVFRLFKDYMENKYGKEGARNRIFVTHKFRFLLELPKKRVILLLLFPMILEACILCYPVGLSMAVIIDIDSLMECALDVWNTL